ncbi:MAG TPA: serine hydrolase [Pyrinomonadaceae bacterium]|nr:serine hydrolase [Pyrinomonadaceae bacterium]
MRFPLLVRAALVFCLAASQLAPVVAFDDAKKGERDARNAPSSSVAARIERVEHGLLPPVLVKGDAGWSIEERMRHHKVPGLSVAVINDFKVEWVRAYGVKDVETKEPVTTETLFQAGSISKPVAATVALKHVERGRLTLDGNINDKLVSWKIPDNEFTAKRKVTLANLLSHTAGLTVHGFPGYAAGERIPTLPQVLDGAEPANTAPVRVDLEPGTKFRYSGGGTTVMQLALTDIERKPFPALARETVLKPLKMDDSTYEQPLSDAWRKRAASGHRAGGVAVEGKIHVYPEMAAAGLWTTPTDLAKFAIEMQLSLQGKSNRVLSRAMTEKMLTPVMDDVALGFFLQRYGKDKQSVYFGHDGADEGFRAMLLVHKEKGYGAVVMVNSDNGQIMGEVLRSVAREYGWDDYLPPPHEVLTLAPEKLDMYAGRYLVNPDRALVVAREGARLSVEQTLGPKFELLPVSETLFIRRDANLRYEFAPPTDAGGGKVSIRGGGGSAEAPRVAADALVPYELLAAGKVSEGVEAYRKIKKEQPANAAVTEGRLNNIGYELLRQKKYAESLAVFTLNAELYPQSSNVYDSLADAYRESGDRESAIKNYRRSLGMDPKNKNAAKWLKEWGQN